MLFSLNCSSLYNLFIDHRCLAVHAVKCLCLRRHLCWQIVSESLRTTCKCHGVSGACAIKTCWRALPDIRAIALAVQRRHAVAVEVKTASWPESMTSGVSGSGGRRRRLVPSAPGQTRDDGDVRTPDRATSGAVGPLDLVYYTISPDYCLPDAILGSVGTRHRLVSVWVSAAENCQHIKSNTRFQSRIWRVVWRITAIARWLWNCSWLGWPMSYAAGEWLQCCGTVAVYHGHRKYILFSVKLEISKSKNSRTKKLTTFSGRFFYIVAVVVVIIIIIYIYIYIYIYILPAKCITFCKLTCIKTILRLQVCYTPMGHVYRYHKSKYRNLIAT